MVSTEEDHVKNVFYSYFILRVLSFKVRTQINLSRVALIFLRLVSCVIVPCIILQMKVYVTVLQEDACCESGE